MIRLTDDNFDLWKSFEKDQNDVCYRIWKENAPDDVEFEDLDKHIQSYLNKITVTRLCTAESFEHGRMAFRESLRIFEAFKAEIWIAYALAGEQVNPRHPITKNMFPHIEMALTVLTNREAPFIVHMGIARTVYHEEAAFKRELPQHKNLSVSLHAFAAQATIMEYPHKVWMRTCPIRKMGKILEQALIKEAY